ncbi:MAG: ribosomal protein S18-alanine N-acetyltransferase [Actinomycetota bacterium]|nr:ribosomal protein S18-alanine N-acetyltransferase [Actinomycetota bacterium]MEE2680431.1 ribosomal protein S18-alanine N-acetyltransferase [Actinomycetota bacterium]|tara:strand:+ start:130 stop:666 length:537 start_codon:yes stop_codon:yes gene_type:complete
MMTAETHVILEAMKKRHVRAIRSIDKQVYTKPWTASMYHDELRRRDQRVYYVARHNNRVAGYGGAMIVHDEGHITSVAVDPQAQGLGIAQRLMVAVHRGCLRHEINAMTLEVRVSNERAQSLYRRFGYAPAGVRAGYYADNGEDALVMWCHDVGNTEHQALLNKIEDEVPGTTDWGVR